MDFKYQSEIDLINSSSQNCNCPQNLINEFEDTTCYRFVFNPIETTNNFLPPSKINPIRLLSKECDTNCNFIGLSLFSNEVQIQTYHNNLKKTFPKFKEKIGTHIAKGKINKFDGSITDQDGNSHFNIYEYKNTELTTKFIIHHQL
jgi:hypothetical protein